MSTQHQCKTCNYRTARTDNFKRHEKMHAGISCNVGSCEQKNIETNDSEITYEFIREAIRKKFEDIRHRAEQSKPKSRRQISTEFSTENPDDFIDNSNEIQDLNSEYTTDKMMRDNDITMEALDNISSNEYNAEEETEQGEEEGEVEREEESIPEVTYRRSTCWPRNMNKTVHNDDPNDLCARLRLLITSYKNINNSREINCMIAELRESGNIE